MNSRKDTVQNYVPFNPNKTTKNRTFNDLDTTLKQVTFNEILNDPDYHFENSFVTNFDLIHHQCRGDELSYSKKHYETIANKKIKEEILDENVRNRFICSAIRSERKDEAIEKKFFKNILTERRLKKTYQKRVFFYQL